MTRKQELLEAIKGNKTLMPLIEDMIHLEMQLDYLRTLPMIKVDPEHPERQKATAASKQYKEFMQQYLNALKVVLRATGADGEGDDSPLSKWIKAHGMEIR